MASLIMYNQMSIILAKNLVPSYHQADNSGSLFPMRSVRTFLGILSYHRVRNLLPGPPTIRRVKQGDHIPFP